MKILIKNCQLVDPRSKHNGNVVDILINNGKIEKIAAGITDNADEEVKFDNCHVSPGWIDLRASFRDPGHEYKEDLNTGLDAARSGGFTGVCVMPSTQPAVDDKAGIEYIYNRTKDHIVNAYPIGAISKGLEGKELAEIYDMASVGAVAFTDDKHPISHAGLMERALLYSKTVDGVVMNYPVSEDLAQDGVMNEGVTSTVLGLKGIPTLAEEIGVTRDLELAAYCEAPIHLGPITSGGAVAKIREAKKNGVQVTCDTTSLHLIYTDADLMNFDTNLKLSPPLRSEEDRQALIAGIADGTIDIISSDHAPEDVEDKRCEFEHAADGALNLETSFPALLEGTDGKVSLDRIVETLSINPGTLIGHTPPVLEEGSEALLTLFNPILEWEVQEEALASKTRNTPFGNKKLTGKALGIVVGDRYAAG